MGRSWGFEVGHEMTNFANLKFATPYNFVSRVRAGKIIISMDEGIT